MRPRLVIAGMALASLVVAFGASWVTRDDSSVPESPPLAEPAPPDVFGVFEGRIPCTGCERIKVRLTLSSDGAEPAGFRLELIHVGQGDERQVSEGEWWIESGAAHGPDATTYVLDERAPDEFRRYLAVGDDILLFIDADGVLVVGDAGHSFTLSRTG
jgi:hypothetical protein